MKNIKKILFAPIIFALLILTSCGKTTAQEKKVNKTSLEITPNIVLCANAVYKTVDDIPEVLLSYCFFDGYDEIYGNYLFFHLNFGKSKYLNYPYEDRVEIQYDSNIGDLKIDKNNQYYLYIVNGDEKVLVQKLHPADFTFDYNYSRYIKDCWFMCTDEIKISKNYFDKEEGEVCLSAYHYNKADDIYESLASITIKYTKDDNGIKIIAPEGSFSGKDLLEGKTQEEIYQSA